ncbi:MAG: PD-(D/E)XK nuclease family protein [Bryobacterales bacterium]|nr:PD-(D/E)XK nuclease family protein [Bryobacterales bacterium]
MDVRCYNSYAELIEAAGVFLREHSADSEVLVVGPTRGAVDDLLRFHTTATAGVHRYTMHQLVGTLSASPLAERGMVPVNRLGVEALAARAVHHVAAKDGLEYFEPVSRSPGFARALARTLMDLRLYNPDPEQLRAAGLPGEDLARLRAVYEDLLQEGGLADYATLLRLAASRIGDHPLTRLPLLLMDVPVASAQAAVFLRALADRSARALILLHSGDEESLRHWGIPPQMATKQPSTSLEWMRDNLFQTAAGGRRDLDQSVDVFSAAGEGLECIEIARRIQALAAEGVAFDEIAILLRTPERYQPLLEEAFARAGIACHFTHGAVRPDPAGRAFLALLACRMEGYPATRFAEYLSFGQTPPAEAAMAVGSAWGVEDELLLREPIAEESQDEASEPTVATPTAWERLIVDAAVVGGRDRWETRLRGLEQQFLLKLAKVEDGDEATARHLERQLELLRNLERLALPVIERLAAMPGSASWGEWLQQLTDLAQLTLRQPGSVLLALNELWPMAEVGPVTLDEVSLVLTERLRFLRRPPARRRYGQVWAGALEEARGQAFRVVFLPGLSEGMFPKKAFEDPLLLDEHRRKLTAWLPKREDRLGQERLRLRIAAAAAAERIVISFPRADVVQNRPRVPSFYAMEVVRAAAGYLPELKEFERQAARGALTRLGWPAPSDPAMAVDPLEFDLASLEAMLSLPRSQARGRARYLLDLNPHLARSLRSRYLRWKKQQWSYADGLVVGDPVETAALLDRYRLRNKPWSASTLQLFAACPYRFVLHGIHYLRPREEPVPLEEMDALIRGELFHRVQFELFQRAQQGDRMMDVADEVLDRVAAEYADQLKPAIPRVWQGEVEDLRADLHGWLRRMEDDAPNWRLAHSELAFGLPLDEGGRDVHSQAGHATILDGIQVRGSIDWIERHSESNALRITDHKTGRAPKRHPKYVGGGSILQPLLYAMAAEAVLNAPVAASRLYYATQRGAYERVYVPVSDESRAKLGSALKIVDDAIRQGMLPAAPAPDACKWCDFTPVCGPREEERARRKPRFVELDDLRGMP